MKKILFIVILGLIGCSAPNPSAQEVVDMAIKFSGTEKLKNITARFSFRGINYDYQYRGGNFRYVRTQTDSAGNEVRDVLINSGLNRFVNGSLVKVADEKKTAYSSSVNSVIYFAFLPLWLNDDAVFKEYNQQVEIAGKRYHKIKVTFDPNGGGEDYEDVFFYWFDVEDYSMDYLAYSYNEKDGKGMRFRVAYNPRKINGVVIQDYKNLKPKVKDRVALSEIDQAFVDGELVELSLIELEDVVISSHETASSGLGNPPASLIPREI